MYTAPLACPCVLSKGAPTTAVFPEMETA